MIEIVFLKDFATRKKGDVIKMDSLIASDLIKRKVAKVKSKRGKKENK